MIQFKTYPIFVNYSDPDAREDEIQQSNDLYKQGLWPKAVELDATQRKILEVQPNLQPTGDAAVYEKKVIGILGTIASTRIGKLLFESLRRDVKVWIVPFWEGDAEACSCAAATTPGTLPAKLGGGIRLYFEPWDSGDSFTAEDVLFHEMVHAYRSGVMGLTGTKWTRLPGYQTAEEFVAIHLQNVYLDLVGKTMFYKEHDNPRQTTKDQIYDNFSKEELQAFAYFLQNAGVARIVGQWPSPHPSYNPWRDYPTLLQAYLKKNNLESLPPL